MTVAERTIERERHMRRIESTAQAHNLACFRADYNAEYATNRDFHSADTYDMFIASMKRAIKDGYREVVIEAIEKL